jgi:hypothetical protein
VNGPDPDDLVSLAPWLRRERSRGAPPDFADRVMAAVAARSPRVRTPKWLEVAALALAAPILLARLVALVLVFVA